MSEIEILIIAAQALAEREALRLATIAAAERALTRGRVAQPAPDLAHDAEGRN